MWRTLAGGAVGLHLLEEGAHLADDHPDAAPLAVRAHGPRDPAEGGGWSEAEGGGLVRTLTSARDGSEKYEEGKKCWMGVVERR